MLIETLEETPWFVYFIFFYVVYMGLRSLRPRTIPFWQIFPLPALLVLWSLTIVSSRWDKSLISLGTGIGTFLVGAAVGWWILSFYKIRIERFRGTIALPGSKWTLALALSIFAVRYYFGYIYATQAHIPSHFILIDFSISGFLIGNFIGRALRYLRLYIKA